MLLPRNAVTNSKGGEAKSYHTLCMLSKITDSGGRGA